MACVSSNLCEAEAGKEFDISLGYVDPSQNKTNQKEEQNLRRVDLVYVPRAAVSQVTSFLSGQPAV